MIPERAVCARIDNVQRDCDEIEMRKEAYSHSMVQKPFGTCLRWSIEELHDES